MSGWSEKPRLVWVRVDLIKIPEIRLRSRFTEEEEKAFTESINLDGILQPIHVFEDENGDYWLADGRNRLEVVKSQGKPIIPAYVMRGSKQDAIIYSAKLNVLRGKVNVGELAELVSYLYKNGLKVEELATALHFSKGYISQLLTISENLQILENLKKGLVSKDEAYKMARVCLLSKQNEKKPSESLPGKQTLPEVGHEGLTDEDLNLTTSLKEVLKSGKRFKPLGPEDLKPEPIRTKSAICDFCGRKVLHEELRFLRLHAQCYDEVVDILEGVKAEREAQNEPSQP